MDNVRGFRRRASSTRLREIRNCRPNLFQEGGGTWIGSASAFKALPIPAGQAGLVSWVRRLDSGINIFGRKPVFTITPSHLAPRRLYDPKKGCPTPLSNSSH